MLRRSLGVLVASVGVLLVGPASATAQASPDDPIASPQQVIRQVVGENRCEGAAVVLGQPAGDLSLTSSRQTAAIQGRLVEDVPDNRNPTPALEVTPRPDAGVTFVSRHAPDSDSVQVLGQIDNPGALRTFEFDHHALCEPTSRVEVRLVGTGAEIEIVGLEDLSTTFSVGEPWAIDATGAEVPTWYGVEGTALRQFVDTTDAVAPVVFDPTYSTISCAAHYSNLNAAQYLNMYGPTDDFASCPVMGMFRAANPYRPAWGFETNVANDYGKIMLRQDGDCSPPAEDTGFAWDFQVPCRAHDYCYDLRKAAFSGTVSDGGCDRAFYDLMEAHCNNRVLSGDCRLVRDIYYLAVIAPGVVTDPNPGIVEIPNRETAKCADVEGPSPNDGTPIQQWSCVGVSNQRFRIHPAPNAPGLFHIKPTSITGKCVRATSTVFQWTCSDTLLSERFRIQGALNEDMYSLRDALSSFGRCWHVPGNSYSNGTDLDNPTCNDLSYWYIWRIRNV